MSRRIDFRDDPDAPKATSIVPSANVAVTNDARELLMIRRTDNGNWAMPGGAVDLGESLSQAGVRETKEESGVDCEITGLSGITPILSMSSSTRVMARSARSSRSCSPHARLAASSRRATKRPRCDGSHWTR